MMDTHRFVQAFNAQLAVDDGAQVVVPHGVTRAPGGDGGLGRDGPQAPRHVSETGHRQITQARGAVVARPPTPYAAHRPPCPLRPGPFPSSSRTACAAPQASTFDPCRRSCILPVDFNVIASVHYSAPL